MANDILVSLDPVTAERKEYRVPGGKTPYSDDPTTMGPHSLECDADGNIWITCAIGGKMAKFVRQYADLRTSLSDAAKAYGEDVRSGQFPGPEHSF